MSAVDLDPNEWGQVMAILSTAPWRDANPLLMKIGNQLQQQQHRLNQVPDRPIKMPEPPGGNGQQEASHE